MSFVSMYKGSWLFHDTYQYMVANEYALVGIAGPIAGPVGQALQVDAIFRRKGA